MELKLYDDVLGTKMIKVLLKYCSDCKATHYPGFVEIYNNKVRYYEESWKNYKIFISTFCTAFSIDFLHRFVCLKQKCHPPSLEEHKPITCSMVINHHKHY